jgi:hypothetical protein
MPDVDVVRERLEELRTALRAERISYGDLAELQGLAGYIEAGDTELLEAAGVPEFEPEYVARNGERAARGARAMLGIRAQLPDVYDADDEATAVGDAIADLLHYVESLEPGSEREDRLDGAFIAERALSHFVGERDGDDFA